MKKTMMLAVALAASVAGASEFQKVVALDVALDCSFADNAAGHDVADQAGVVLDDKSVFHCDIARNGLGQSEIDGGNVAFDDTGIADDQITALDVAGDPSVKDQIAVGLDITVDDDTFADESLLVFAVEVVSSGNRFGFRVCVVAPI